MAALLLAAAFAGGCSRREKVASPRERNELVQRFFTSLKSNRPDAAIRQGQKLLEMDPGSTFMPGLIQIQQSNAFIAKAQGRINRGDLAGAARIIDEGIKTYPDNSSLHDARRQIRQMRNAPRLLEAMRRAKSASAMNAALTAATIGLGNCMTPRLEAYFKSYEKRCAEVAAAEEEERKSKLRPTEPSIPVPGAASGENAASGETAASGENAAPGETAAPAPGQETTSPTAPTEPAAPSAVPDKEAPPQADAPKTETPPQADAPAKDAPPPAIEA